MLQDKKVNGFEVLEKVTGLSKAEQIKILEGIKENNRLLNGCSYHDFSEEVKQKFGMSKWRCRNCGGVVEYSAKQWYEKGIEHEIKKNT